MYCCSSLSLSLSLSQWWRGEDRPANEFYDPEVRRVKLTRLGNYQSLTTSLHSARSPSRFWSSFCCFSALYSPFSIEHLLGASCEGQTPTTEDLGESERERVERGASNNVSESIQCDTQEPAQERLEPRESQEQDRGGAGANQGGKEIRNSQEETSSTRGKEKVGQQDAIFIP